MAILNFEKLAQGWS